MILSPQNTPFTTKSAGTSYELMIQRMTKTKVKASNIIGNIDKNLIAIHQEFPLMLMEYLRMLFIDANR